MSASHANGVRFVNIGADSIQCATIAVADLPKSRDNEKMRHRWIVFAASIFILAGGCGRTERDSVIATEIERQVTAMRPDVKPHHYARFYAHDVLGSVRSIWVVPEGYSPLFGRPGTTSWVAVADLPVINDGGCTVIEISYISLTNEVWSVECGGSG